MGNFPNLLCHQNMKKTASCIHPHPLASVFTHINALWVRVERHSKLGPRIGVLIHPHLASRGNIWYVVASGTEDYIMVKPQISELLLNGKHPVKSRAPLQSLRSQQPVLLTPRSPWLVINICTGFAAVPARSWGLHWFIVFCAHILSSRTKLQEGLVSSKIKGGCCHKAFCKVL